MIWSVSISLIGSAAILAVNRLIGSMIFFFSSLWTTHVSSREKILGAFGPKPHEGYIILSLCRPEEKFLGPLAPNPTLGRTEAIYRIRPDAQRGFSTAMVVLIQ
jgi:hypothetical protein